MVLPPPLWTKYCNLFFLWLRLLYIIPLSFSLSCLQRRKRRTRKVMKKTTIRLLASSASVPLSMKLHTATSCYLMLRLNILSCSFFLSGLGSIYWIFASSFYLFQSDVVVHVPLFFANFFKYLQLFKIWNSQFISSLLI